MCDSKECSVCYQEYNKSKRSKTTCPSCNFEACKTCVRYYLTHSIKNAHCMSCKKDFTRDFMVQNLNGTFVNKTWKKHRENVLMDREKARLPETMVEVERRVKANDLQKENDDLLESAEVYGNFYGIPKSQVLDALSSGKDVIMKLDVQGAKTIKSLAPNALFIFLAAPTIESLRTRLEKRMTESPEALETRLNTAKMENTESKWFDHIIINEDDEIDKTVKELEEIIFKARNISRGPIFN